MTIAILLSIISILALAVFVLCIHCYYQAKDWKAIIEYVYRYGVPGKLRKEGN